MLVVVHYQVRVRVRISNRKTRSQETQHSMNMLIPTDLKVVDLVKAFRSIGNASEVYQIPDLSRDILTTSTRTAMELGWKHGTELRLEME